MNVAAANNLEHEAEGAERDERGHHPVKILQLSGIHSGWRCTVCRKNVVQEGAPPSKKCLGCILIKWSMIEVDSEEEAPL